MASALSAAFLLTGCDTAEEEPEESAAEEQNLTTIGVRLAAPGLISGTDPEHVSGAEIDVAVALSEQLEVINDAEEITWVPFNASATAEQLDSGAMDLVIGQFSGASLTDNVAWVGPYANVEAGLLTRSSTSDDDEESPEYIGTETVSSLDDLEDASVCVVAGSLADGVEIPAAEVTTQRAITECETGMRSGRYDVIAADDMQLAGLLADLASPEAYSMQLWSELPDASDDDAALPEELLTSDAYWIGTTPEHCEATATALTELVSEGIVEDIFSQWQDAIDYAPEVVEPEEMTTQHCNA